METERVHHRDGTSLELMSCNDERPSAWLVEFTGASGGHVLRFSYDWVAYIFHRRLRRHKRAHRRAIIQAAAVILHAGTADVTGTTDWRWCRCCTAAQHHGHVFFPAVHRLMRPFGSIDFRQLREMLAAPRVLCIDLYGPALVSITIKGCSNGMRRSSSSLQSFDQRYVVLMTARTRTSGPSWQWLSFFVINWPRRLLIVQRMRTQREKIKRRFAIDQDLFRDCPRRQRRATEEIDTRGTFPNKNDVNKKKVPCHRARSTVDRRKRPSSRALFLWMAAPQRQSVRGSEIRKCRVSVIGRRPPRLRSACQ